MTLSLKIAFAAALGLAASSALAQQTIGAVKRSSGQVLIERSGVKVPAPAGAELLRGDRVITGRDGYASIAMRRTAPLTIGPENDVALERFALDERPVVKRPAPAILQGLASFLAVNRQR